MNGLIVGALYLPNGNPRPGPKFDYKLAWFEALLAHAQALHDSGAPVVLAGDFNVMPTERDVYKPERWLDYALFAPEVRAAFFRLLPELLLTHKGKYVVVHNEEVVDIGDDFFAVARAVRASVGQTPIYVGLVSETPEMVVESVGFRLVTK